VTKKNVMNDRQGRRQDGLRRSASSVAVAAGEIAQAKGCFSLSSLFNRHTGKAATAHFRECYDPGWAPRLGTVLKRTSQARNIFITADYTGDGQLKTLCAS